MLQHEINTVLSFTLYNLSDAMVESTSDGELTLEQEHELDNINEAAFCDSFRLEGVDTAEELEFFKQEYPITCNILDKANLLKNITVIEIIT